MSIYRRVLKYYRPFLPATLLAALLSLGGIALNLLKPWPFKIIVDNVIPRFQAGTHIREIGGGWNQLWWAQDPKAFVLILCIGLVLIQLLWGMSNWVTNYVFVKIGLQ